MQKLNVAQKLIQTHLISGSLSPGAEIAIRIDQTLTQDATGTFVMLELEAMGLDRARTELSVQYVDHNLVQEDHKNADDHLFLKSACEKFGIWYSRPGNGISHPVHQERFGRPGKTLLGSDSHTPAAGALGMLAVGAGGMEVAMAIAGEPFYLRMPKIMGVKLIGKLPEFVSAKDIILEMLRRHSVRGGVGKIIEYYGPGLECLSAMDRHVIANMGAELGATTSVFPADQEVQRFLRAQGREAEHTELVADDGAQYDEHDVIDFSALEPLIAMPSSPDKVVPVREVAGQKIHQAYIGSSANPGFRDFAMVAEMVHDIKIPEHVSLDINPSSRQVLESLLRSGHLSSLIHAGARLHQAGCNGCIGMGQAPATHTLSLRTVPRNFPGRSGTREDKVCLVSPETAAASALKGEITDPRTLGARFPHVSEPDYLPSTAMHLLAPLPVEQARQVQLVKGPNIAALPDFGALPVSIEAQTALKVKDNISTDEIMPAGARVLPFRSNIQRISEFAFEQVDETYAKRTQKLVRSGIGHVIIAGDNYGQGSSREHAAVAPKFLGLRFVVAKSFARIHWQNLVNFGVLPLTFAQAADYERIDLGDQLRLENLHDTLDNPQKQITLHNITKNEDYILKHDLSERQIAVVKIGGLINWIKHKLTPTEPSEVQTDSVKPSAASAQRGKSSGLAS